MNKAEQEACRLRAEAAAAARSDIDPVGLHFDWNPTLENGRLTFQVRITRKDQISATDFEIDLGKLLEAELQQLHAFLTRRHAGLGDTYDVTRAVVWLLSISLQQRGTPPDQIDTVVRSLLLSSSLDNQCPPSQSNR